VIFIADEGLSTLMDFKYRKHFKADRGVHGIGKNQHGAWGENLVVKVPVGTLVIDDDSGAVIADLTVPGQEAVIARGGRGGKGNSRFANATHKAPSIAENGEPGEEKWIRLELKLLADVGLVGFPNAGKSTFISRVSAARPKIADYPFTTLVPNLGVVQTRDKHSFVLADIPGLIEGAHEGAGLGHDFLRHIERNRMLVFMLDAAQVDGRDVLEDYITLRQELEFYNPELLERPYLIVANKLDLPEAEENLHKLQELYGPMVYGISGVTGQGIDALVEKIYALLQSIPTAEHIGEARLIRRFDDEVPFVIDEVDGVYQVSGKRIEHLVVMTNFNQEESLQKFQRTTARMGLDTALREKGIKVGDTVRIMDMEFDFSE
jgi:GTP-binding protein